MSRESTMYGPYITAVNSRVVWARWCIHSHCVDVCWAQWDAEKWRNSTNVWCHEDMGVRPDVARDVARMLLAAADVAEQAAGDTPEDLAQDLRDRFGATDATAEQRPTSHPWEARL